MHALRGYLALQPSVFRAILAEFFLQLVHNAFFLIANFYMSREGYSDHVIARVLSLRFLAVLVFSLPLGLLVRRRRLLPFLRAAGILVPLGYALILVAIPRHWEGLLGVGNVLVGAGLAMVQVLIVPYILRHERPQQQAHAMALSFTNWSTTTFLLGIIFYALNHARTENIPGSLLLAICTGISCLGFVVLIGPWEDRPGSQDGGASSLMLKEYDWGLIARTLTPSLIIGIGAGLSIPFISLFFKHAFAMGYEDFSLISSAATFLVSVGSLYGPHLLHRFGYELAVVWSQGLSIVALALMGVSEFMAPSHGAMILASVCYLLRQPLMNMANPIVSELTMNLVGPRNREMTSALKQALWAASWFLSSQLFRSFREAGYSFVWIFGSTALIYTVGVVWYARLIRTYRRGPL
ncbi:MFS transporter [Oligoflexus tunisiensis]|uniref:MFS transporter n=1 Tax=Oligoflexus tunisiensis TaxID=708132 RepID=UPI00114CC390|nr:MFS transporter [Oligoflexus tunisiensis]